jgi:hypothetical protein
MASLIPATKTDPGATGTVWPAIASMIPATKTDPGATVQKTLFKLGVAWTLFVSGLQNSVPRPEKIFSRPQMGDFVNLFIPVP